VRPLERDVDAGAVGQHRAQDFLLHFAVEPHRNVLRMAADVDQRVLLGQPGQRGEQRRRLLGADRPHHGLEARRREHAVANGTR